jgi:hypothetical protein
MHLYSLGATFQRIAIHAAGPFPHTDHGNRYLLITMDYFTKWPEAYATAQRRRRRRQHWIIIFSAVSEYRELHSDQGSNF